ncbi:hypothetical protein BCON_0316g00110 [Botryotinia convoluta]|uniref:2EXR domain-containing protein n=1 Tax=Botryotinia convoluta TaxID=54673 RepID=A0A4Z1HIL4_9HELO|nr:hypothetical protein BCON_0316g00110 [Botryotinia convoluta]
MFFVANTPSFPQFRRFPKEIRLSVWERAIPEPRIVHIVRDAVTRAMKSYTSIPAIPRVNHESFPVASKHYHRAFSCCNPVQDKPDEDTLYVWFDFERDFLLIDYDTTGQLWPSPEVWLANKLMGSGNVLQLRHVENSEASIRRATKYSLVPSYDLSFCDVKGADHVDVQDCIRLFDTAKMSYRPMLGPLELPRLSRDFQNVTYLAQLSVFTRYIPTRHLRKIEIDGRNMVNLRLKAKFEEERERYEAYILQNLKNYDEHRAGECNCKMTEAQWLSEFEIATQYFSENPPQSLELPHDHRQLDISSRKKIGQNHSSFFPESCGTEDFSMLAVSVGREEACFGCLAELINRF